MNNSSNAPVIFINGLIGTLNDPKFHSPLGDRPVIAPDLNGYGARSDIPVGKINIRGQVKWIYEVIQAEYQGGRREPCEPFCWGRCGLRVCA